MATTVNVEPSEAIDTLISKITLNDGAMAGMTAAMSRASDFDSPLQAKLTGIAIDPMARMIANRWLDGYWSDADRRRNALSRSPISREIIIGSGYHAAVYAATRVLSGFPRPLVLERSERVGGTFALTTGGGWYLNSRNRAGGVGLADDQQANLNYLPGAPVQLGNVSMLEFPPNTDMSFVIRLTLAQYADVVTGARVTRVDSDGSGVSVGIDTRDRSEVNFAGRVIDARGLGDPTDQDKANGTTVLTFPEFIARMDSPWPLKGVRRVAVIGGGDSGKCTVESLLGAAPQPAMAMAMDYVERVDWYAQGLPSVYAAWQQEIRGRYQFIGRYLRPDGFGVKRLNVISQRATPVALPDSALVNGRSYDLIVLCTGNRENIIPGLEIGNFEPYDVGGTNPVARKHYSLPAFRVGPHARLPFTEQERTDGIAMRPLNAVSMFRTGRKTATLAATLDAPERGDDD